ASRMADDDKVPAGTRYDALRIIALDAWDNAKPQLTKYLAKGVHDELHMGAISGLSDVDRAEVPPLLLDALPHLSKSNRTLALDALLRTNARIGALLDAIAAGKVAPAQLSASQVRTLRELSDESLRLRAQKLIPEQ